MANEVVEKKSVFGGNVTMLNPDKLAAALGESAAKDPRGAAADGSDYMNFSGKGGRYEIGIEKVDADPEELWVIDISRFEDGWICWKENRPAATRLYPLGENVPTPDMNEHGPFTRDGDGWYQAKSLTARSVDSGQQVYFKNNSVSGVSEFAQLQKAVVARLRTGQPAWPVVSFRKEKFTSKGFNNWKPILAVDGWLNETQLAKLAEFIEDEDSQFDLADLYEASMSPNGGTEEIESDAAEENVAAETVAAEPAKVARRNKRL
jgi:hypothetical protein